MKKWLNKYLGILIKSLESWKKKVEEIEEDSISEAINFHSLTPVDLANEDSYVFYEKSLKWALNQPKCLNIAISGIYGSGKSSIINTFLNKHDEIENIRISLAEFNTYATLQGQSSGTNGEITLKENEELNGIEKSIIHQIIYTVDESKIPNSRLKRIKQTSDSTLSKTFIKISLLLVLTYLFFNLKILCFFPKLSFLYDSINYFVVSHFVLGILIGYIIWTFFRKYANTLQNIGIEKLNFKNGEIQLKDKSTNSILNEYVDELIYFFSNNPVKLVVFEDLDRFNNLKIFSDLRQLNLLINSNETIKKNGKVVFLYAVKDDLFSDEQKNERVKFFDFILPVISVINSSNSYAKLKEILGEDELKELSDQFLQDICLYINDLRLLKNICNEYQIFKQLIKEKTEIKYDLNKIFAMAIYKNYFPKDYNDLVVDKGNLFIVLGKEFKQSLLKSKFDEIDISIAAIRKDIIELGKYANLNEKEIQMVYLHPLIQGLKKKRISSIYLNNELTSLDNIDESHLKDLFQTKNLKIRNLNGYEFNENNDYENLIVNEISYKDRLELDKNTLLKGKNEKINELESSKIQLKSQLIASLLQDIESVTPPLNNPMVMYLVKNGFIDEDYQLYISHYIEGGLSKNDTNFLLHIKGGNTLNIEFDFPLQLIPTLIKRLHPLPENEDAFLNYSLLDYVLNNSNKDFENYLFSRFSNWKEINLKFIESYFERGKNTFEFLKKLNEYQEITELLLESDLPLLARTKILTFYLLKLNSKQLNSLKNKDQIKNFLTINDFILDPKYLDSKKLSELLRKFDFKIADLTKVDLNEHFDFILNNNSYLLTYKNIEALEKKFNDSERHIESLKSHFLTEMKINGNPKIVDYIMKKFDSFLIIVYEKLQQEQNENENVFLEMLDLTKGNISLEKIFVSKTITTISDIKTIKNPEIQEYILNQNRLLPTWENLIMYLLSTTGGQLEEIVLNNLVYTFISNYIKDGTLDFNIETVKIDDVEIEEILRFKQKLLLDVSFDESVFIKMIENTSNDFLNEIEIDKWDVSKLEILILNKRLELTNENLDFILSNYKNLYIDFIISQFQKFLPIIESYDFEKEDLDKIIMSEDLTVKQKINFLSQFNFESRTKKVVVSKIVLEFIVKEYNNLQLNKNEQLIILKSYSDANQLIAKKFLILIFEKMKPSKENSKDLVIALKISNFSNLFSIEKGHTEKVNNNDENVKLLNYLERINLISSFKPNKKGDLIIIQKKHRT